MLDVNSSPRSFMKSYTLFSNSVRFLDIFIHLFLFNGGKMGGIQAVSHFISICSLFFFPLSSARPSITIQIHMNEQLCS
jgi:hypothetical protein